MSRELDRGGAGDTLVFNKKLTEEFKKISGNKDVKIKWNARIGHYHLMMKGKFIMYLNRPITGEDRKRVNTHFRKMRGDWYRKNVRKERDQLLAKQAREKKFQEDEMEQDARETGYDMLCKQSVWVTRP